MVGVIWSQKLSLVFKLSCLLSVFTVNFRESYSGLIVPMSTSEVVWEEENGEDDSYIFIFILTFNC